MTSKVEIILENTPFPGAGQQIGGRQVIESMIDVEGKNWAVYLKPFDSKYYRATTLKLRYSWNHGPEENHDYELPNIFSLLNEFYLIKKSKTEKQHEKWVKSKQFRLKKLKKRLDNFIQTNSEFELSSRIKYEPYSWKNPDMEQIRRRVKSKKNEEKSILNSLIELENDVFLVSKLFETTSYRVIIILIYSNKNHLKLLNL